MPKDSCSWGVCDIPIQITTVITPKDSRSWRDCIAPVRGEKRGNNLLDEINTPCLQILQLLMAACQQVALLFLSMLQGMVGFSHATLCEPWVLLNWMCSSASSPVQQSYIKLPACRDNWFLIGAILILLYERHGMFIVLSFSIIGLLCKGRNAEIGVFILPTTNAAWCDMPCYMFDNLTLHNTAAEMLEVSMQPVSTACSISCWQQGRSNQHLQVSKESQKEPR